MLGAILVILFLIAGAAYVAQVGTGFTLLFIGAVIFMAYKRFPLIAFTTVFTLLLGRIHLHCAASRCMERLSVGDCSQRCGCSICGPLRKALITRPFMKAYMRLLPAMSQTEKEALEAGTVWWDGELFTGKPKFEKLLASKAPQLTAEEQAFIDGPCEELCRMYDDWEVTHQRGDMPPRVWDYLKHKGFFAMIIPKKYGGLEFSAYAHSCVLVKLASRAGLLAATTAVPNSLGPAELLNHYGTEEQKNHYLPRLARGEEVPVFRPDAPARGFRRGLAARHRHRVQGPVAGTGDRRAQAQLLQAIHHARPHRDRRRPRVPALRSGQAARRREGRLRHHLRAHPAQHGGFDHRPPAFPTQCAVPERPVVGQGRVRAARYDHRWTRHGRPGWRMLVEQLSVGRCISLPSNATAAQRPACSPRAHIRVSAGSSTCRWASSKVSRR
jgi:acyl-CoA dehydrogenase